MPQSILRQARSADGTGLIGQSSDVSVPAECFTKHWYCRELDTEEVL